jgi:hypothetical protein
MDKLWSNSKNFETYPIAVDKSHDVKAAAQFAMCIVAVTESVL